MSDNSYYISSFTWTTIAKILNAVVGFFSVPILIGIYGKSDYGILGLAMACNSYMHLLDLGMNTGAVRFYSLWKTEGKFDTIRKVSHSNISFYCLIAAINAAVLCSIAIWGEGLFSINHSQFLTLRSCLFILAAFSLFNWSTTAFSQLLVADRQMAFTMKMQAAQALLKALLIVLVMATNMPITVYFLILTAILAGLIIPYSIKSKRDGLIDNFKLEWHWQEFKPVLAFSLSIFALSLFQITATESRPIVLGICGNDGADIIADFKVLSVVPTLIITIGSSFSAIFLPRSAEMYQQKDVDTIRRFSYKWTGYTTIIANVLCFPFILCAGEVLTAYVGEEYARLAPWLILWCITALIQIHTTPGNSLVIASGKTRQLVLTTALSCIVSIIINCLLCKKLGAGSAVTGYFFYVVIVIGLYYLYYYKKLFQLNRLTMFLKFLTPTILATVFIIPVRLAGISTDWFGSMDIRLACIIVCIIKTMLWFIPYFGSLFLFRILTKDDIREFSGK